MRVFESRKVEAKRRVGWPVQGECHLECGAATRSGGEPASNFVMNVMREGHVCHRALVPASHGVHWILEVGGDDGKQEGAESHTEDMEARLPSLSGVSAKAAAVLAELRHIFAK